MADWGGVATGAGSGALAGASFGPIGAAGGAILGGITSLFGNKKKKMSTYDKRQKQLADLEYQSFLGEGPLADLYNYNPEQANKVFDETIARKSYRDLNEKAIPSVTGQFRSNGLMNSSYAGDAISKLARDVQESLDAQRSQYLYAQESEARGAKRNALSAYQNRNTQAYDTAANEGGFDIGKILDSLDDEGRAKLKKYLGVK